MLDLWTDFCVSASGQGQQTMRTLHQQQQLQQQQQSSTVIQGGFRKEYAQTIESSQQISGESEICLRMLLKLKLQHIFCYSEISSALKYIICYFFLYFCFV